MRQELLREREGLWEKDKCIGVCVGVGGGFPKRNRSNIEFVGGG